MPCHALAAAPGRTQGLALRPACRLAAVPCCHLVFTLPHAFNPLAWAHPRWVQRTLMQCTAATFTEFAANPQWLGATGAFTLVLHTWTQDLHLHIHALMACGGLDAQGPWRIPTHTYAQPDLPVLGACAVQGLSRQVSRVPCSAQAGPAGWHTTRPTLRPRVRAVRTV